MVFRILVVIIAVTNNSIISPSPPSTTAGEQNQQLVNTDYGQYVGNVQIKSDEIRKRCSRDTRCACSTRFFFGANWMPAIFLLLEIFLQLHLLREPGYQPRSKGDQCPLRYCESIPVYSWGPRVHNGSHGAPQPPTQAPSMGAITYARANDSLDMLSGVRISCPKTSGSPTAILK